MNPQNIENSFKELLEKRQGACDWIKSSPQFGNDFTYAYPYEPDNHPYKNLCNIILWCEFWFKKLETSNNLQRILPKYNSEAILIANKKLYDMMQQAYIIANAIKNDITQSVSTDKVINSNDQSNLGLSQYNLEQKLFQKLDPSLTFLRPKLEVIHQKLNIMAPILEKNQIIMQDLRECFTDSHLYIDILENNLYKLVDKYGMDDLNLYAKCAWISYIGYRTFDIKSIIEDSKAFIFKDLLKDEVQNQIMLQRIITIFFSEFYTYYDANIQVTNILCDLSNKKAYCWDLNFLEYVMQLYTEVLTVTRLEEIGERWGHDRETDKQMLQRKQHISNKKLLWKFAIKGCLTTEEQVQQIDLSKEDIWEIDVYKMIYLLKKLVKQVTLNTELMNKLISALNEYIVNRNLYSIYKVVLFFIGENIISTENNKILEEIKATVLKILDYSNFELIVRAD